MWREALVAPEPVRARPRKAQRKGWRHQRFVEPPRRRSARQAYSESACARLTEIAQPPGDSLRQGFGILECSRLDCFRDAHCPTALVCTTQCRSRAIAVA